jgi:hypothetical protein
VQSICHTPAFRRAALDVGMTEADFDKLEDLPGPVMARAVVIV